MKVERFLPRKRASYRQTTDTPGSFADALRAGERIYLSAQSGADPDGNIAAPGDAAAQTNAALDRLEAALIAAGGSLEDITKLTTSIVDRGHRRMSMAPSAAGFQTCTRSAPGSSSPDCRRLH